MSGIEIVVEDPAWKKSRGLAARLKQAAEHTLAGVKKAKRRPALTVLLTDDAKLKTLNRDFRGKDKATNVLSFPAQPNSENYLGDVAIAYGVTDAEARASRKRFADHATHLVVHGVLHLLGYDHVNVRDAAIMEPLESAILAKLGVADPYADRTKAA